MDQLKTQYGTRLADAAFKAVPGPAEQKPEPDVSPEAPPSQGRPVLTFEHRHTAPLPAPLDLDALALLGSSRGPSVVAEAESAVRELDETLRGCFSRMTSRQGIREAFRASPGILMRRVTYVARVHAWRRLFGLAACTIADVPPLPNLDPEHIHADAADHLVRLADSARKDLATLQHQISSYVASMADDYMYGCQTEPLDQSKAGVRLGLPLHPQDACLERLNLWAEQRRQLQARLAVLEGDATRATEIVMAHVRRAVKAAGGVEAVTAGAVAAAALQEPPKAFPGAAGRLAEAESALAKLIAAGIADGPAYAAAQAKVAGAKGDLAHARETSVVSGKSIAAGLVEQALAGSEPARARLEQLATACPAAFVVGFGDAMTASRYDLAVIAELSSALGSI